jgi:DNA modification methylase
MQLNVFEKEIKKTKVFNNYWQFTDNPQLVSFRELVPEILSTTYLTHSIYYYPAKFIPQVVRFCINEYTQKNDWIIDPFAGSGTVGLEAIISERNAILTDLNFLLNHIIPVKIPTQKEKLNSTKLKKQLDYIFENKSSFIPSWSNLNYWYPNEIVDVFQRLWAGQKSLEQDLYTQIIQSVLVKVSKQFSYAEHKAPKLFISKTKREYIENLLKRDWQSELKNIIYESSFETLITVNQFINATIDKQNQVKFYGGVDSSTFQHSDDLETSCMLTSPPYLQAQEYIRTFKLDLFWLGYDETQVKALSKLEIPYRKATRLIETETLNKVRIGLEREDLKEMLNSYFCHTINALENASKNLKTGGKACIFVGNPKVDGIEVETWKVLLEYFTDRNFNLIAIFEDQIKTRQLFKARKNKNPDGMKSEFLLVLEKR